MELRFRTLDSQLILIILINLCVYCLWPKELEIAADYDDGSNEDDDYDKNNDNRNDGC